MAGSTQLVRWGGRRLSKRMTRAVPWVGLAIAVAGFAAAVRRKGVLGGTFDTGLNAVPFLGAIKSAAETLAGRDLIPDRLARQQAG